MDKLVNIDFDMLEDMFNKQKVFQKKCGANPNITDPVFVRSQSLALIDEIMEALHETAWKPWKKQQSINLKNFRKELIDAWHFLLNLSLAAFDSATDLHYMFSRKHAINNKRQDEGY